MNLYSRAFVCVELRKVRPAECAFRIDERNLLGCSRGRSDALLDEGNDLRRFQVGFDGQDFAGQVRDVVRT